MTNMKTTLIKPEQANPSTVRQRGFQKRSSSFSAVVTDLEVGECASKVQPVDPEMTLGELAEQMSGLKATLTNNSNTAIRQAKSTTGGTYQSLVTESVTAGGELFLVLIVRRTA